MSLLHPTMFVLSQCHETNPYWSRKSGGSHVALRPSKLTSALLHSLEGQWCEHSSPLFELAIGLHPNACQAVLSQCVNMSEESDNPCHHHLCFCAQAQGTNLQLEQKIMGPRLAYGTWSTLHWRHHGQNAGKSSTPLMCNRSRAVEDGEHAPLQPRCGTGH